MTAAALHAAAAELVSHAVDAQIMTGAKQAAAQRNLAMTAARTPVDLLPVLRDALGAALMAVLDERAERAGHQSLHGLLPARGVVHHGATVSVEPQQIRELVMEDMR